MKKFVIKTLRNGKTKLVAAGTVALASGSTFAADYTAEIGTASTEGGANVTATILAVISIAILGFGVKALLSWLK